MPGIVESAPLARVETMKNSKVGSHRPPRGRGAKGGGGGVRSYNSLAEVEDTRQARIGGAQVGCGIPPHPQLPSRVGKTLLPRWGEGNAVYRGGFRDTRV